MQITLQQSQSKIIDSAGLSFKLQRETNNTVYFTGQALMLKDQTAINNVDLRVSKGKNVQPAFLSFEVSGKCISKSDVKEKYPDLSLTGTPGGRSLDETTSYTTVPDANGMTLTFSFAERNPDCLKRVIFDSI
ncbi:hypothetical protein [Erwinia sp. 9145]|uniref:hypothetical protein n=1 Tax=Erwinia sp. 9145 TaxID=1500895 RepID=UPI0012E04663|nr:hypothetical protein [Erwinia sp. 9145]